MSHAEDLALEFVEQKQLGENPRIEKYLERLPFESDREAFFHVVRAMELLDKIADELKPDPMFVSQLKNDLLNRLAARKEMPSEVQGTLGSTVREARKRLRLSLAEAAKRLGLPEDAFSNLESDYLPRPEVSDSLVSAAARVFSLSADLLRRLRDTLPSELPQSMGRSERYAFARRKDADAPQHLAKKDVRERDSSKSKRGKDLFDLLKNKTGKGK
jgi:transcriptional regulator with XRE-family HTH domain